VNDDWILRRLEKWGRREGMPFLGPQKAAILQQLVQQQQPRLAVEVGSMAGYSAIVIAQVRAADTTCLHSLTDCFSQGHKLQREQAAADRQTWPLHVTHSSWEQQQKWM